MPHMRGGRASVAFWVVLAALVAYEGYAFFIKTSGEARNIATAADRHLTGEVAGEAALVQGFVTHADGFDGVDVWGHASGARVPQADVVFEITEESASPGVPDPLVARVSVPAAQVVGAQPFHVAIPRVDGSAGHHYKLNISAPRAVRGDGVRFEASGPAYPEGTLTLGGREEWGDLQFQTTAERTTIYRNVRHLRQSAPGVLRSDVFLVAMFLLFNWALATLLYELAFANEPGPEPERE
jgi:hypothetical protein